MAVIQGVVTGNGMEVEATSKAARVLLYDFAGNVAIVANKAALVPTQGGYPNMGLDHDSFRMLRVGRYGSPEVPARRIMFCDVCEGAVRNSQRWVDTLATMTIAQSATGITLNNSAITTINTGALMASRQAFLRPPESVLQFLMRSRSTLVANQVGEWGFAQMGTPSATTAQIDNGAFWRFTSGGTVVPVLSFSSSDVVTGSDIAGSLSNSFYYDWIIFVADDRCTFICARSDTGAVVSEQVLRFPITQQKFAAVTHLNVWVRVRNTGSAPASAGQLLVGEVSLYQQDIGHFVPMDSQLAENMQSTSLNPTAITQAAQFGNSAAPASASLSNTAAGYTTLGGLYQFAAQATNDTDFCLFGYAVPAPYRLKIKGMHISMYNRVAANAATPATTLLWGLGLNGASVNLSTGGYIRRIVGVTSIPITAAIGAVSPELDVSFPEPLICEPGTTLAIIMRQVAGAATATQVIQGAVDVRGVFE